MAENETSSSTDAYLASERQKSDAIKRHYDVVTDPQASETESRNSLRALGILSRDTGRKIIISLLDKLRRQEKLDNKNPIEVIKNHHG